MEKVIGQKWLFGVDLTLCGLLMLLSVYNMPYTPFVHSLLLLRIWVGFLLHRRSAMAVYPIGLLALGSAMLVGANAYYMETVCLDGLRCVVSFFGGDGRMLVHTIISDAREFGYGDTMHKLIVGGVYLWLVVCPLIGLLCLWLRKRLVASAWSIGKSLLLCAYLVVLMAVVNVVNYPRVWGVLIGSLGMCAIPRLFKDVDYKRLLTRGEESYLLVLLLLMGCCIIGGDISRQAVVAVVTLPAVCYMVFNRSCRRQQVVGEVVLVVIASMVFWAAQYTTDMVRIMLLLLSLAMMGVVTGRFIYATQRKVRGGVMMLLIGMVIPITSIGYNPYSVLHASRAHDFEGYVWCSRGLFYVEDGDMNYGIRDRYGLVMPAHFTDIKLLDSTLPYVKARDRRCGQKNSWQIYDIERHELVTEEHYSDIYLCGKGLILLEQDSCRSYMKCRRGYNWASDEAQYCIADTIPANF